MTGVKRTDPQRINRSAYPAVSRRPGVLVADDTGLVLTMLKFALEARGFAVWLTMDGGDAIDLYRRHHEGIDLVLLDVHMPGLDGPHTLDALRRFDPDVLACFMTGDAGPYGRADLLARGASRVFDKPFAAAELARALDDVLDSAGRSARPDRPPRPRLITNAVTDTTR